MLLNNLIDMQNADMAVSMYDILHAARYSAYNYAHENHTEVELAKILRHDKELPPTVKIHLRAYIQLIEQGRPEEVLVRMGILVA